jgi:hypothetical protein
MYTAMPAFTERQVEARFRKYKRQMIQLLGKKATTSHQLTTVGRQLFGAKYRGTFSQDYKAKPTPRHQYFIINVDRRHQPGSHWVGVVKNGKTYYIYDSYARTAKRLLPVFTGKILKYIESDRSDAEQYGSTEICGPLTLAWLCCVHELGIRNALKI